ncbi:MAG: glycosyltransferase [Chromatiaceae bacterium]|nr:MAG: glycosyltransferase [Chromatiaceae bacterium]
MNQGARLLLLTRHGALGSSSRVRLMTYRPWLEQAGFAVEVSSFFDDVYLRQLYTDGRAHRNDVLRAFGRRLRTLFGLRRYRLLWIEKELFPFLPGGVDGFLPRLGVPYVLDYDDATFHRYDLHPSPLVRALFSRRLVPLLRGARMVTAGNAYLADYARSAGAGDVRELPTVVDIQQHAMTAEPTGDELRIGWIGSPSTAHYLGLVRKPLRRLARERALRLVVVGARDIPVVDVPLEFHDWAADTEAALLATLHLGIMPLTDGPWERGKCGYKLIQYMACGKPVIASPVGVNADIVSPDVGLLAANDAQWLTSLRTLAGDAALRRSFGRAGRAKVEARYSLQIRGPQLAALLAEAATHEQ